MKLPAEPAPLKLPATLFRSSSFSWYPLQMNTSSRSLPSASKAKAINEGALLLPAQNRSPVSAAVAAVKCPRPSFIISWFCEEEDNVYTSMLPSPLASSVTAESTAKDVVSDSTRVSDAITRSGRPLGTFMPSHGAASVNAANPNPVDATHVTFVSCDCTEEESPPALCVCTKDCQVLTRPSECTAANA